jgi:hypothetical protein
LNDRFQLSHYPMLVFWNRTRCRALERHTGAQPLPLCSAPKTSQEDFSWLPASNESRVFFLVMQT